MISLPLCQQVQGRSHGTQSVAAELNGIEIVISRSVDGMTDDLPRLKWIVGATWAALILSLCLVIFSVWLSIQPRPVQVMPNGVHSFQSDGRTYLTVPEGTGRSQKSGSIRS